MQNGFPFRFRCRFVYRILRHGDHRYRVKSQISSIEIAYGSERVKPRWNADFPRTLQLRLSPTSVTVKTLSDFGLGPSQKGWKPSHPVPNRLKRLFAAVTCNTFCRSG